MDNQSSTKTIIELDEIKRQLDKILAQKISSFIEIDSEIAILTFNLFTLSSLILLVERDREIESYPDEAPELYTQEELFQELSELGMEVNDDMEISFQLLEDNGYVTLAPGGRYASNISSYNLISFIDKMFPGMAGMNIVAYVMQLIDEVFTDRKSIEDAQKALEQTLTSKKGAYSFLKTESRGKTASDDSGMTASLSRKSIEESKRLAAKLKNENIRRLEKLRKMMAKTSSKPSFLSVSGYSGDGVKIKDLFPKGPSDSEIDKMKAREEEEARLARQAMEAEKALQAAKDAEKKAAELKEQEERQRRAEIKAKEAEEKIRQMEARQAELAAREAEEKIRKMEALEAKIAAREAELAAIEAAAAEEERKLREASAEPDERDDSVNDANVSDDSDDIEKQIAAFEQDLAMPCPVCNVGKIVTETTAKGKEYFSCTNEACRFVSWEKPFHLECPLCKNPYLVENITEDGSKGLKCPRAACTFKQDNQLPPDQNMPSQAKPKKKKLVRRVKRRR